MRFNLTSLHYTQVEVAKFEELEEVHAELKLKQALWNSLVEWDVVTDEWLEVGVTILHSFCRNVIEKHIL